LHRTLEHEDVANDSKQLITDALSRLFSNAMQTASFDQAYTTILQYSNRALQRSAIRSLVTKMCETNSGTHLIRLPFIGLQDDVDSSLAESCANIININQGPPYHKVLYAWRVKRGDFRGAAEILHERLQRLQSISAANTKVEQGNTAVTQGYLTLINILGLVDPANAWILTKERTSGKEGDSKRKKLLNGNATQKKKILTLADVRKEYQDELDRLAKIENNQFSFVPDYENDSDAL
jgi:nuclear pore complex protein Nup160